MYKLILNFSNSGSYIVISTAVTKRIEKGYVKNKLPAWKLQ